MTVSSYCHISLQLLHIKNKDSFYGKAKYSEACRFEIVLLILITNVSEDSHFV